MNALRKTNISPEIEAAIAEGREIGLREAAAFLLALKQRRVPWLFRGLNGQPETDAEGWGDLMDAERKVLKSAAEAIIRKIDGSAAPEHEHIWSSGGHPICAICGERQRVHGQLGEGK